MISRLNHKESIRIKELLENLFLENKKHERENERDGQNVKERVRE